MAVTRRVHKFEGLMRHAETANRLTDKLNSELANAERIVQVVYEDGYWWVFTETFGLATKPPTP